MAICIVLLDCFVLGRVLLEKPSVPNIACPKHVKHFILLCLSAIKKISAHERHWIPWCWGLEHGYQKNKISKNTVSHVPSTELEVP